MRVECDEHFMILDVLFFCGPLFSLKQLTFIVLLNAVFVFLFG